MDDEVRCHKACVALILIAAGLAWPSRRCLREGRDVEDFRHVFDQLRNAAGGEPSEFAKLLQRQLTTDFDDTFDCVKVQKLLLKRRSTAWISGLQKEMDDWLEHAPLKGKQKARVRRHISVCAAIQEVLEAIDKSAAALRIWQASTEDLLRSIFAWVENRRYEEDDRVKTKVPSGGALGALRQMELSEKALRSSCDYVTRVLNQVSHLGLRQIGTANLTPSDIQDALVVAALADLVLHVLDCYTYKNFRVSIGAKRLELHGLKSEFEEAQRWSSLRGGSRRLVDVRASPLKIEGIERLAEGLSCDSESFADFLESDAGMKIFQALQPHRSEQVRMFKRDVGDLIDLDFVLRTRAGAFRTDELLECWSLLYQVAVCAYIWRKVFRRSQLPVLPLSRLSFLIRSSVGGSLEQSERLVSQFLLNPAERNQDPFFRPLIKLNEVECAVAGTFIETGRFSRNIFTIAIREGRVDFSAKGLKPLRGLQREFLNAGYQALLNVPLATPEGPVTDVDIAAAKDGFLFLGQTKVLIQPDTAYDSWKVLENLRKAAGQLRRSLLHTAVLAERFGLGKGDFLVVPFLLTNVWDFTGATVEGFKVVDFSYLSLVLTGGEMWNVRFEPTPTREIHKLIDGRYPSGAELSRLLLRPIHEAMFQRPELQRFSFSVGEWTITVPIDVSKAPGGDMLTRMTAW